MRADEFLKKYGLDGDDDNLKDTSLRGKSLERALHPGMPHAGTPHDWEDWEKFQAEERARANNPAADDPDGTPSGKTDDK
ncbi:hypothetical protein [Halopseudomonas sp.]|uniref:hypothetical protein n=1 Tax=Halopseudomonas sp. TaxID=2901191 RepID=UPI0035631D1A